MRTFTGSWGFRVMLLFWLAMACAVIYFGVVILLRTRETAVIAGSALFFLLGGGFGIISVIGLLESFAKYRVDTDGITRIAWNGTHQMRWIEVARIQANGQRDGGLTLVDQMGRKLTVEFSLLGKAPGEELRGWIEPHLAPVRERQQREVSLPGRVYYPTRSSAWAGVVMIVLIGVMLVMFCFMPVPADQRIFFYAVMAFFGACGLFFGAVTIALFTDRLVFTEQGVTQRRWFRTHEIPFHHVNSVMSRMQTYKGSSWELTTIEGDAHKAVFTSKMPDYPVVMDFVKAHVARDAQERGASSAVEVKQKAEMRARIALPIVALVYFLLLAGFGLWFIHMGNERLADYVLMDKEGRRTVGRVTGTHKGSSKSGRYLLEYEFQADGAKIASSSPVSYEEYMRARVGAPLPVIYVPGKPHTCRAEQSTGRRSAEGNIRVGYLNIAFAFILTPLLALTPYLRKKKAGAATSQTSDLPSGRAAR